MDDQVVNMLMIQMQNIKDDVKEMRSDVRDLMSFRWKMAGFGLAGSLVLTLAFEVGKILIEK